MTVLDAYALVAFLVGGPAAAAVRGLLREGRTAVATANLAEALDVAERVHRLPIERAMETLEPLFEGPLGSMPLDVPTARRAAGSAPGTTTDRGGPSRSPTRSSSRRRPRAVASRPRILMSLR